MTRKAIYLINADVIQELKLLLY